MANYAGVIVDISLEKLDRVFDYRIPAHLEERIHPGTPVWVPFGMGNRQIKGFVLSVSDTCSYEEDKVKDMIEKTELVNDDFQPYPRTLPYATDISAIMKMRRKTYFEDDEDSLT